MFAALLETLGRVHPLVVHMPIGLAIAAALVEAWRAVQGRPGLAPFTPVALWLAAAFAAVACGTGWLFAEAESETSDLFWHRWLGIAAAVVLLALAILSTRALRAGERKGEHLWHQVRGGSWLVAGLIAWVGHLGGSMVWGGSFFTAPLARAWSGESESERERPIAVRPAPVGTVSVPTPPDGHAATEPTAAGPVTTSPVATGPVTTGPSWYASEIQPLLATHCYKCHGNDKSKGDLTLDDPAKFIGVEVKGVLVVHPGDPADSELLVRVGLPAGEDGAMPPEGDRLAPAQIEMLREWIAAGASVTAPRAVAGAVAGAGAGAPNAGAPSASNDTAVPRTAPPPVPVVQPPVGTPPPLTAAGTAAIAQLRERGVLVQVMSQREGWLEVNASSRAVAFTNVELALAAPLCNSISELNVARTAVTDEGLRALPNMPALTVLRVDGTAVGDEGLRAIAAKAPQLQSLNLVGSRVTDGGCQELDGLAGLVRVYLWNTSISPEGVAALKRAHPKAAIESGRMP